MKISASIVRYNHNRLTIRNFINTIDFGIVSELVIVDNSDILLELEDENVTIIPSGGNIGYGRAHNIALKSCFDRGSDVHIVLNIDLIFPENFWSTYKELAVKNDRVVPKILNEDGTIQNIHIIPPTLLGLILRFIGYRKPISHDYFSFNKPSEVVCFSGCFLPVTKYFFDRFHAFDPKFWMYFEDVELSERISKVCGNWKVPTGLFLIHKHEKQSFKRPKLFFSHLNSALKYLMDKIELRFS
jgi:GT2 family glycosyltransferase